MRDFGRKMRDMVEKKRADRSRDPPLKFESFARAQSVQRRSERSLICRSEACWKVGSGLLTTL